MATRSSLWLAGMIACRPIDDDDSDGDGDDEGDDYDDGDYFAGMM